MISLLAHQFLLDRLSPQSKAYPVVAENLRLLEAGLRGEERLLRLLQSQEDGFALHNVCLENGTDKVQIDCLFITSSFCLVMESKNISGDLYFDPDTDEFYRLNQDQTKQHFPNPYYQLTRNIRFMDKWLKTKRYFLPVNGAAFLTSKSVTLHNNPFKLPIYKIDSIFERIASFRRIYQKKHLAETQLLDLRELIEQSMRPYATNGLLEYYGLTASDILTGIVCPNCQLSSLTRGGRLWICAKCNHKTKSGLQEAVEQYFVLIKPTITNKEFREFFGVESMKTANNLLSHLKLQKHGAKRNRYYTLL